MRLRFSPYGPYLSALSLCAALSPWDFTIWWVHLYMASAQVFRMVTRHQVDAALIAHYRGDTRAVEARERSEDKLPSVVVLSHDPDGARSALRAAKAKRGRGRPGVGRSASTITTVV